MAKKNRKMTEAQIAALKEQLWQWAMTNDPDSYHDWSMSEYDDLRKNLVKAQKQAPEVKFEFNVSAIDAGKIFNETEESCLTKKAKKAILANRK